MDPVASHYTVSGLLDRLDAALRLHGKDPAKVTVDDLAPLDEFHMRGREATEDLAALAGLESGDHVVDVGCGIGGSSRFLAARCGCRVTGIDLTPEFCSTAEALTRRTGLDGQIEYRCASALAMPLADASADVAWTQHAQMNIADKPGLYREIARIVKPGGRFAFHDILAGPGGIPHFPVHWADYAELSHLVAPDDLRALLERSGFRILAWHDKTGVSVAWFKTTGKAARDLPPDAPPPLGVQLLLGGDMSAKVANVTRNMEEGRITFHMGVAERLR